MKDPTPLQVVLTVLAVYRLTLLLVADRLLQRPRRWLYERSRGAGRLAYFVTCPWCVSVWVGALGALACLRWGDGWGWWLAALTLACSAVTGFLASFASPDG